MAEQVETNSEAYSQSSPSERETAVNAPSNVIAVTHSLTHVKPRAMDIFSTALASANINLDNFMEEEDGKKILDIMSDIMFVIKIILIIYIF